jgi:wobble nucleotide-excising tRNase
LTLRAEEITKRGIDMIKSITTLKNFGVFKNHVHSSSTNDFTEFNIIFGWNYSGKTTLSRVFRSVEKKCIPDEYKDSSFQINCSDGNVDSTNLALSPLQVSVFNTDFIDENLSWNGHDFSPILLLGSESIEIQKNININNIKIEKGKRFIVELKERTQEIVNYIAQLKKDKAKYIKQILGIVETYTALHLDNNINEIRSDPSLHLVPEEELPGIIEKAKTDLTNRLFDHIKISYTVTLNDLLKKIEISTNTVPDFANVIEELTNNSDLSKWIENGLDLHKNSEQCLFCTNKISLERLAILRGHFSEDQRKLKEEIAKLKEELLKKKCTLIPLERTRFYKEFKNRIDSCNSELSEAVKSINKLLDQVDKILDDKLEDIYHEKTIPDLDMEPVSRIKAIVDVINQIIEEHNAININMEKQKSDAIIKAKRHFAAEFFIDNSIERKTRRITEINVLEHKISSLLAKYEQENKALEASISNAQKGKEELNLLLENILGHSTLYIDVENIGDNERFLLKRSGSIAKNLSEGEKTAISFCFYLIKLKEITELSKCIVYIDDPISSLDSNHIFQINSLIKNTLFWSDVTNGGMWKLKCYQLFISTHNFDFFNFIKELPIDKKDRRSLFHVKRVTPSESKIENLPLSYIKYTSEYHYLFSVINAWDKSETKTDLEYLMQIPNAFRRFVELYTYSKIPSQSDFPVDKRAEKLWGAEKAKRIIKVLHYFSHLNNFERMMRQSDLLSDIEGATGELLTLLKEDTVHYEALKASIIN